MLSPFGGSQQENDYSYYARKLQVYFLNMMYKPNYGMNQIALKICCSGRGKKEIKIRDFVASACVVWKSTF